MSVENLVLRRIKKDIFNKGDLSRAMAQIGLKKSEHKYYQSKLIKQKKIKKARGGWFECIK